MGRDVKYLQFLLLKIILTWIQQFIYLCVHLWVCKILEVEFLGQKANMYFEFCQWRPNYPPLKSFQSTCVENSMQVAVPQDVSSNASDLTRYLFFFFLRGGGWLCKFLMVGEVEHLSYIYSQVYLFFLEITFISFVLFPLSFKNPFLWKTALRIRKGDHFYGLRCLKQSGHGQLRSDENLYGLTHLCHLRWIYSQKTQS